jgi:hypothetical protein
VGFPVKFLKFALNVPDSGDSPFELRRSHGSGVRRLVGRRGVGFLERPVGEC